MRLNKGVSLLEVVIAIGLVSVVLMSLVTLSTKSVSNSTVSKERNQATRLTQETIEWLRQQRDQSWSTLDSRVTSNTVWCFAENNWNNSGPCTTQRISETNFKREATFNKPQPDTIEVTVVTEWIERGNTHQSRSATTLTKWQ